MKSIIKTMCIIILLAAFVACNYYEHNYTREECEIIKVSGAIITIKDKGDNVWEWESKDGETFKLGEIVTLKMNDNFTSNNICDDIIKKVEK